MSEERELLAVYAALLALLGLTVGLTYVDLGVLNFPVMLLIAFIKVVLIALIFMELRRSIPVTRLIVCTTLIWLMIFSILSFADYMTRGWPVNPEVAGASRFAQPAPDVTGRR